MKFLLVVVILGVTLYLTIRVIERRGMAPRRPRRGPEPRVTGPDDDPDFLRGLDRPDDDR